MHAITQITDRLTLVMLSISIWSGRKKLRPEDLHLSDGEIPPEDLVSLGSKRVCDPDALKAFHRIKQSAERACLRVGTRFLGGFAVPHEQAEALAEQLETLKLQFEVETGLFLADYDRALEGGSEPAGVRGAHPSCCRARQRRRWTPALRLPAHSGEPRREQPGTLEEEVQELGNGIFAEVGQMARELEGQLRGQGQAPPPRPGHLRSDPREARLPVLHRPPDPARG